MSDATRGLTREQLVAIVDGVLGVMWPPGDTDAEWSPDTLDEVTAALGEDVVGAWISEVEHAGSSST